MGKCRLINVVEMMSLCLLSWRKVGLAASLKVVLNLKNQWLFMYKMLIVTLLCSDITNVSLNLDTLAENRCVHMGSNAFVTCVSHA